MASTYAHRRAPRPPPAPDEDYGDIELARRVAQICGPHSGAAGAVADYERREAAGERPMLIANGGTWVVMPRTAYDSISR